MKKEQLKERLILLTGGAGYKGATLCRELLARGYRLRVLDSLMYGGKPLIGFLNHPNFEFIRGDVVDPAVVKKSMEGVTDVIHLAAIVGDKPCERDPKRSIDVNYKATQCLAETAKKNKVEHFIFASTCSNYGIADTATPADENRKLNPVSLYAETKIDCEKLLIDMAKSKDFFPIMLRFSTAFGLSARTRFDLTVNSFTYEAIRDNRLIVFAEESWRPFIHVLDMAYIYCKLLELPKEKIGGEIYNAGWNSQNFMKKEIVDMIREVLGDFEVDYINTIEDLRSYRVAFDKIERILGFEPQKTVTDGVRELAAAITSGVLTEQDFENNRLK